MKKHGSDKLYSEPREAITDFVFDESVVRVFSDMIGRSVPGYSTILSMIPVLVRRYVQAGTHCYDLGCSLGASTLAMRHSVTVDDVEIVSVDNSPAMIEQCAEFINRDHATTPVRLECDDVCNTQVKNASFAVMNFTLQFIAESQRLSLLKNIHQGMIPGGALLLSEKIVFEQQEHQQWMTELHHEFKKANGYSELEISQKRSALENVLIPETIEAHHQRLKQAGFSDVITWFQCFNFVSMLAVK